MTAVVPDIPQQTVFNALADFIAAIVDCQVIRGQANRVSMPVGDVIYVTPIRKAALAVSVDSYTTTNRNVQRSTQFDFQVDCYGAGAADRAQAITALLRDGYAFDQMAAGVKPLYASDAQQMPLVTGEEQYLERWTFEASLQANPTVSVAQDSMSQATIQMVAVDAAYPPA